jgi:hypothetical protein
MDKKTAQKASNLYDEYTRLGRLKDILKRSKGITSFKYIINISSPRYFEGEEELKDLPKDVKDSLMKNILEVLSKKIEIIEGKIARI